MIRMRGSKRHDSLGFANYWGYLELLHLRHLGFNERFVKVEIRISNLHLLLSYEEGLKILHCIPIYFPRQQFIVEVFIADYQTYGVINLHSSIF